MPAVSQAQERLMQAAAHTPGGFGGVPQNIGEEFVKDAKGHATGTLFVAPDGDVLLLCRAREEGANFQGHWALPGGGVEEAEDIGTAADRENAEELGGAAPRGPRKIIDRRQTPNGLVFHTFAQPVAEKFAPRLNGEHTGYAWVPLHMLPTPIHPAVQKTMEERLGISADMEPEDFAGLREGLLKWLAEEEAEPEHASDESLAFDYAPPTFMAGAPERECFAFDRSSVRTETVDGRLVIEVANISKANICPYLGKEIPKWRELGLEPDRVYQLLRDPEELAKGALTFNDLPLLSEHVAVTADRHRPELVVGTTGSNAEFQAPYLRNGLVIWTRDGIDGVNSGEKKQLSSAYRYRADMTPGVFQGARYDGVMRDIVGNHVALVKDGRVGDDVVVGDSKEGLLMATKTTHILTRRASQLQGAVAFVALPLLAKDARLDMKALGAAMSTVTVKSLREKPKEYAAALHKIFEPVIAKDKKLSLDEVEKVIDLVNKYDEPAEKDAKDAMETDPTTGAPIDPATTVDADPVSKIKEFLAGKISPEDLAKIDEIAGAGAATDESDNGSPGPLMQPPGAKDAEFPPKKDGEKDDEKDEGMGKDAVNAAIKTAVDQARKDAIAEQGAINQALRDVKPHVGELAMSFDSAEAVYRHVLGIKGVPNAATMHKDALKPLVDNLAKPKPRAADPAMSMDAATVKSWAERNPNAARIRQV